MARRLIGTGVTNSQGIAIMNKDAQGNPITGYTGTGAGRLQIIAESGDLQSETYDLYDCIKYDLATTANHNDIWDTQPTRGASYSTYSPATGATDATLRYCTIPQQDICIEFDIYVKIDSGANFLSVRYGTTGISVANKTDLGIGNQTWYHIKWEIVNGQATWTNTDTGKTKSVTIENYNRFYFRFDVTEYISFKNFIVYAI